MEFKETTIKEVLPLVLEASNSNDFVNSINSKETILQTLEGFSDNKDFHIFALLKNNEPIAFTTTFPNKIEGRISIGHAFVKEGYRGEGIGQSMRTDLISWIKKNGFKEVYAKTWKSNTAMVHLNEKMGFKLIEEIPNDRVNGDSTVKYLLRL